MAPRVTAILVTYQSAADVGAALEALRPAHEARELEAIVVDNRSSDDTVAIVRRDHPWATLVESSVNLGYGRGLNAGLARATTEYVLFMNPDAVIQRTAVADLARFLDAHPRAGMCAPAIVEGDGDDAFLQPAGVPPTPRLIVGRAAGIASFNVEQREIRPGEAPFETDWLCGAILLARTSLMKKLGGFDPRFFLYFEETDLCRRVRDEGFELWAVGEATARHVGGASAKAEGETFISTCIAQHYFQSRYYYLAKFHGRFAAAFVETAEFLLMFARSLTYRARRRPDRSGYPERMRGPFFSMPRPPAPADDPSLSALRASRGSA